MLTPIYLYGSETWNINTREQYKIQASEMKILRTIKQCTNIEHLTNDSIHSNLKIHNINYKIIEYQNKWEDHMQHTNKIQQLKKLHYKPRGYRNQGRPVVQ